MTSSFLGFILTRQWRDTRQGVQLDYWLATDAGPVLLQYPAQNAVAFIRQSDVGELSLNLASLSCEVRPLDLCNLRHEPISALYFKRGRDLRAFRDLCQSQAIELYEADIKPSDRFLMERFITGAVEVKKQSQNSSCYVNPPIKPAKYQPKLRLVSLDIETAMHDLDLYSIGLYALENDNPYRLVMMVGEQKEEPHKETNEEKDQAYIKYYDNQTELLKAFLHWVVDYDPDGFIGWNVVNFDFWYLKKLAEHLSIPLTIGRGSATPHWILLDEYSERRTIDIPGRIVLDGIEVLRTAGYRFESFSLQNVSEQLLKDGKLLSGSDRGTSISELFEQDKPALAEYNLQDCRLVWDIFAQEQLLAFSIARSQLTGLPLDRLGGSVAAFDFQYLPRLHRQGFVASTQTDFIDQELSPGGYVLDSIPGLYRHVLVLDFKSLYPSIIRTFRIDPLGLAMGLTVEESKTIAGFKGGRFDRTHHLLPDIIADLWAERDKAKADKNSALSQAIKIIMNSFYGVLGSKGCRFYDARLASSITMRGHEIIQTTKEWIEQQGSKVIYGDTDSVFVWLKGCESDKQAKQEGDRLAKALNQQWKTHLKDTFDIESVLEMEFETHYQQFVMPTMRGSERGSKKRYAGLVVDDSGDSSIVFKGMENVRTDWTLLARETQHELYRRVFSGEAYRDFIVKKLNALQAGECDRELFYRKRLRQKVEDYQRQTPPHVQAVKRAIAEGHIESDSYRPGSWVEYGITTSGPQLREYQNSPFDYAHYRDKQLVPVVDGLLHFLDASFDSIVAGQLGLF